MKLKGNPQGIPQIPGINKLYLICLIENSASQVYFVDARRFLEWAMQAVAVAAKLLKLEWVKFWGQPTLRFVWVKNYSL